MGWSIGFDKNWNRDIGYGVPAYCDAPGCMKEIDRGLSFVCGGEPYGGEYGCGLYFCLAHLWMPSGRRDCSQLCRRCSRWQKPYKRIAPEHPTWLRHKLRDETWRQWRTENPKQVEAIRLALRLDAERPISKVNERAAPHG